MSILSPFEGQPRHPKPYPGHFLQARQSDDGDNRGFGGSNGAIALYVVFGVIVLAIIFTPVLRTHRGRGTFSSRPRRSVYNNQPTPWNPSSFSHHRGMSQSSGGNGSYSQDTPWAGRVLGRMAPRGREQTGTDSANTRGNVTYYSEWPSSRQTETGDALPFSGRNRWTSNTQNAHVAVPPAYHKIVSDKPPAFQGAPPEYYEEIDLEAQGTGRVDNDASPSNNLATGTAPARSGQTPLQPQTENEAASHSTQSDSVQRGNTTVDNRE